MSSLRLQYCYLSTIHFRCSIPSLMMSQWMLKKVRY